MIIILYKVDIMVLGEMLTGYDYYPLLCGDYGAGRNADRI